jgi:hypothetical protein
VTAVHLLRLYPRAWRERYGEEFLSTIGDGALHLQQIVDIVAGAIDAWLSPSIRRQVRAAATSSPHEGDSMTTTLNKLCHTSGVRYTKQDALVGAALMLSLSVVTAIAGILLKRNGYEIAGDVIATNGFLFSLVLSMPFWILKGQSRRAQVVLVVGLLAMLSAATWLAYLI